MRPRLRAALKRNIYPKSDQGEPPMRWPGGYLLSVEERRDLNRRVETDQLRSPPAEETPSMPVRP